MEGEILLWIQEHVRSAAITPAVEWITHLGDTAFIWILMAAVFFVFGEMGKAYKNTRNV